MTLIAREDEDRAILVRMQHGATNAISPQLVKELGEAVDRAEQDGKGLVLAGNEKFFSIGLDLPRLLDMDRPAMQAFWRSFEDLQLKILCTPWPTACAMGGHATAGGLILALCSDLRFAAPGRKLLGLNELQIGVMVPWLTHLMLELRVGAARAMAIESSGAFMGPEEALQAGLVDEIVPAEDLEARALERISKLARLPREAYTGSKDNWVHTLKTRYLELRDSKEEALLDSWFSTNTQKLLTDAAKKF